MVDRRINFGDPADSGTRWQIEDDANASGGGNFVLAKDLSGNTVLLQYNPTSNAFEYAAPIDMGGENVSNVGAIDTASLTANTSITDAAGVTHSGELADIDDVGSGGNSDTAFPFNETGEVNQGDAGIVISTRLNDTESIEVTQIGIGLLGKGSPPSGLNVILISLDSTWNGTEQATVISGDGTSKNDVTGSPIASYTNTTGGAQDVAIVVDNGQYSAAGTGSGENVVVEGDAQVV